MRLSGWKSQYHPKSRYRPKSNFFILLKLFDRLIRIIDRGIDKNAIYGIMELISSNGMTIEYMTRQVFETYFREQYSLIYRVAFMQMKDHSDAEDVLQEVFVRLLKYQPQFENSEHEKAWFIRTTINICRDIIKSKWHSTTVSIEKIPECEKNYFHLPYVEEDETLWAVLELPEKYRDCLYFFYYEDYSIKEIAQILKMSENTVKTNLRRGREALKDALGGC